jgi:predicted hydrocarbon binding protein
VRIRRGVAEVDLRGSLFCEVREQTGLPLCGFYAAALRRMLESFEVGADARVEQCRATGAQGCLLTLAFRRV